MNYSAGVSNRCLVEAAVKLAKLGACIILWTITLLTMDRHTLATGIDNVTETKQTIYRHTTVVRTNQRAYPTSLAVLDFG